MMVRRAASQHTDGQLAKAGGTIFSRLEIRGAPTGFAPGHTDQPTESLGRLSETLWNGVCGAACRSSPGRVLASTLVAREDSTQARRLLVGGYARCMASVCSRVASSGRPGICPSLEFRLTRDK